MRKTPQLSFLFPTDIKVFRYVNSCQFSVNHKAPVKTYSSQKLLQQSVFYGDAIDRSDKNIWLGQISNGPVDSTQYNWNKFYENNLKSISLCVEYIVNIWKNSNSLIYRSITLVMSFYFIYMTCYSAVEGNVTPTEKQKQGSVASWEKVALQTSGRAVWHHREPFLQVTQYDRSHCQVESQCTQIDPGRKHAFALLLVLNLVWNPKWFTNLLLSKCIPLNHLRRPLFHGPDTRPRRCMISTLLWLHFMFPLRAMGEQRD